MTLVLHLGMAVCSLCVYLHVRSQSACIILLVYAHVVLWLCLDPIKLLSCLIFHSSAHMSGEYEQTHLPEWDVAWANGQICRWYSCHWRWLVIGKGHCCCLLRHPPYWDFIKWHTQLDITLSYSILTFISAHFSWENVH